MTYSHTRVTQTIADRLIYISDAQLGPVLHYILPYLASQGVDCLQSAGIVLHSEQAKS